jgi:F-type H+-transporting ATPase subunit gamma
VETLEALERRIGSARDLLTVVRTMKAMAAVGVRQMERAAESVAVYDRTVRAGFRMLTSLSGALLRPARDGGGRLGLVVFGSDQGMCGAFNDRALEEAAAEIAGEQGAPPAVIVVGLRLAARLSDITPLDESLPLPASVPAIPDLTRKLLLTLDGWLREGKTGRISLIHNGYSGGARYEPRRTPLLPLDRAWLGSLNEEPRKTRAVPLVRAEADELLSALVREHLFIGLYRACAESLASESAARLAAMQRAERDIDERIAELTQYWNTRRQTAITEELLDIVAGYEALATNPEREPEPRRGGG